MVVTLAVVATVAMLTVVAVVLDKVVQADRGHKNQDPDQNRFYRRIQFIPPISSLRLQQPVIV